MQNQNIHSWSWGQGTGGQSFVGSQPVLQGTFAPGAVDHNSFLTSYQQMYGNSPGQPPADFSQWTSAQLQQWQQWQQWQEKYQEWQAQYGKKYAESLAAMGQNPSVLMPGFSTAVPPPVGVPKPVEPVAGVSNPPLPSNTQPIPPPPPEDDKATAPANITKDAPKNESKDTSDELSEAERVFNVQFKQWESEFEEWKKQNQDHPDKAQYREYEKKWEAWREQLLQRLEQMKKKRLEKANEAKTSKDDTKGKLGTNQGKPPETDYGYRTQPPPTPQGPFANEPPKFDKPPPMTQPPPNFRSTEKGLDPNRGAPFSSNLNFLPSRGPLGSFDASQERPNQRFGNFEVEGRFRNPGQYDGPRFGNFDYPPRRFEDRNFGSPSRFPGDNFREFNRGFESDKGPLGNDNRQGPARHRVPSLFDIQVEKPPGLTTSSNDSKPKIWEKNDFDKKQPESKPWGNNNPWGKNMPSPWMQQPWATDKKPSDAKPWEREGPQTERPWLDESPAKRALDRAELSGYVGNILAKLGNVMPPNLGNNIEEPPDKAGEDPEKKCWKEGVSGETGQQSDTNLKNEDENPEDRRFDDPQPNVNLDVDDRMRDKFRRGPFGRDDRGFMRPGDRRNFGNEERMFERGPFGRRREDSRGFGGRFPREDVDERFGGPRNGRRGFDRFDRDERQGGGSFFERFGRDQMGEPVWKPQVFDYSQGRPMRLSDSDEGFKISTVVDYSHGENKQTFDYSHGESNKNKLELKSFDYGHKADAPTVIDYGHGVDTSKGDKGKNDEKFEDGLKGNSEQQLFMKRSRSPRGSIPTRSRSPHSRFKRNSVSPPFKNLASRNRDRIGRQNTGRTDKVSEEKLSPTDGDVSKHSFTVTTVLVEDLICRPGRESRPGKLVFIMRGLPGSGKTYVTKLIKDKEVELGGDPPRILSLDDYFMTEVEKETIDPETGRKVKTKTLEYEYEAAVEPHYRGSLVKAFKKTVSDGFFSFIIVDSVNEKTKDYEEMWSFAKQKGFQVYIAEMDNDVTVCTARNIHKRTEKEISGLAKAWEETPVHYLRLDVRSLLQSDAITEVEMEVVSDTELEKTIGKDEEDEGNGNEKEEKEEKEKEEEKKEDEDEDEPGVSAFVKSRWDQFENSEQNLDRLDGLKRRREGFHATMEDYLQLPDNFDQEIQDPAPGKKRVRWADLEERKQQEKMRAIGFVVGQTDWSRMTDPTFGESALTRTKYI